MGNSIVLARIIGPYLIIAGIGVLFNMKKYQKVMEDFVNNSALLYLGGIIALFFGLLIVQFHNAWEANWALVITVVGWLSLIKGATLIIFPKMLVKITGAYQRNIALLIVHIIIILAIGIFLAYMGYWG